MTQEEKSLLLKDLSSRLSHGVICNTPKGDGHLCSINQTIFGTEYGINIKATTRDYFNDREVCIKPYLRPLSSMTEEERKYIVDKCAFTTMGPIGGNFGLVMPVLAADWLIDFYNEHHIDYRGLIGKGLAIEVTEENNPYEN